MEETVGNHKPFNEPNNPFPDKLNKVFLVYANMLTENCPPEIRKFAELVVINDDKTFSMAAEQTFLDESGKLCTQRIKDMRKFETALMLCRANYFSPKILIGLN